MNNERSYDVAVVGGGLAGLSAAIMLADKDHSVVLFEKEKYPFHKVCGEYISFESWDLLLSLGLPLAEWNLPVINELLLTSPNGTSLHHQLPLGGFGVSRFKIDESLCKIALAKGVDVYEGTRVNEITTNQNGHSLFTDNESFNAKVCFDAAGKRANLDIKWKRKFAVTKPNALNNYIGVKYHARLEHPRNEIALHNFNNGYCGISPIEDNKTCICYLTTASNLKAAGNDIAQMEEAFLFRNPFLKEAFENATMLYSRPITISQISFDSKEQVYNNIMMLGDSAGMIAPLCGNGMSMALFSSKIAAGLAHSFLQNKITRPTLEQEYQREWSRLFGKRLRAGRIIQSLFGREWVTNTTVNLLKKFPRAVTSIIRQTHG